MNRSEIAATWPRIRPHLRRTPVAEVCGSDFGFGDVTLFFKLEFLQQSGSFKARGAFANLLLREIAGVAAWFERRVQEIGVEPELAPTLTMALEAGRPVDAPAGGIAADALAPKRIGERVFPIVKAQLQACVLVTDDAIAQAQQALWSVLRVAAEPAGAAAFAALLSGRFVARVGARVAVVVSGGNISAVSFGSLASSPGR